MKFKVLPGNETFEKLQALHVKVKEVKEASNKVVELLGGKRYCAQRYKLAGGIGAIEFTEKPDGYKAVGDDHQSLYFPNAKNAKALKLISDLPTIEYDELNSIVNFKAPQTVTQDKGFAWISTFGIIFCQQVLLIDIHDGCKFTAPADVIEITSAEYKALKEADLAEKINAITV